MARCGCSGSGGGSGDCNCSVVSGNGVAVSGVGSGVSPYVPTVVPDPAGLVSVGPAGVLVSCEAVQDCVGGALGNGLVYNDVGNQISARLSTAPGNTVVFGPDNGIYAAPGAVALGCGLENGVGGVVQVNTAGPFTTLTRRTCDDTGDLAPTTPLTGSNLVGQAIYCDDDGNLRTKPEKLSEVQQATMDEGFTPVVTTFPFSSNIIQITVTNPSGTYCLCGTAEFSALPEIVGATDTVYRINYEIDPGSGVFAAPVLADNIDNRGKSAVTGNAARVPIFQNICLDPGETKIIRLRVNIVRGTGDNGGFITLSGLNREIRFAGVNL